MPVDQDLSTGRLQMAGKRADERALTATAGTNDANHFTSLRAEVNAAECTFPGVVNMVEINDIQSADKATLSFNYTFCGVVRGIAWRE